jgi:VWFA-related protein
MKPLIANCFVLFLITAFLFAQSYEVSVTRISVWIKATDASGKPVEGLTQDDFEIYEDSQKMAINCFEVTATEVATEAAPTGPAEPGQVTETVPTKKIAIYLDLYNTTGPEFTNIRPRIQQFLDQLNTKNWEVMLVALMPNGKLGIIAPFTKDIKAVSTSLMNAPASSTRGQQQKTRIKQMAQSLQAVLEAPPRVQESMLQSAYGVARSYANEEKNSSDFSIAALNTFTGYLAKLQTAQHIVVLFVSGGINMDPGRQYFDMANKVAEQLGYLDDPTTSRFLFNSSRESNNDLQNGIKQNVGKMNRNDVTVYSINTRGMYANNNSIGMSNLGQNDPDVIKDFQDSMIQMAEETGGLAFYNSQNFKIGFDQVLTDLSQQYLICYSPPQHTKPGKYHKIKVVCKKKGVALRYRTGYLDE